MSKPKIWYSEPYQNTKKAWTVDKHVEGCPVQKLSIWTEKLCWDFLETINVYVTNK